MAEVRNGRLHLTWLLALLQRAFLHESKFMIRWALGYFYQSKFHDLLKLKFYDENNLLKTLDRFIMGPLIVALQGTFLYYK